MDVKKVGEFIKQKRKEKYLTQKELADKLSITDRAISKWERGICCPDISLLKDLSSILDISINELLSGKDIDKLESKETDNVLIESVNQYVSLEKKKNKKLLVFTIFLLLFYIGLVFAMYLTFNQINKTDGLNWEIIQSKRIAEKFYTAIENYDYNAIREMQRDSYGYNVPIDKNLIEDETKCDEYKQNNDLASNPGLICKLKYFEEEGVKFISHKFKESFYVDGFGEFPVIYIIDAMYKDIKFQFYSTITTHNGVITYMQISWENMSFSREYPDIFNKIESFFDGNKNWNE